MIINNDNVTNYPFLNKKGGVLNCSLPYLKTNTSSIAAQLLLVKGKGHFDVSIEWDNCKEMEGIKIFWPGVGYSYPSGIIHRYALEVSEPKSTLHIFLHFSAPFG